MNVNVELNLDHAEFFDYPPMMAVRRAFEKAAQAIDNEPCGPSGFVKPIIGINGHTVGKVTVTL